MGLRKILLKIAQKMSRRKGEVKLQTNEWHICLPQWDHIPAPRTYQGHTGGKLILKEWESMSNSGISKFWNYYTPPLLKNDRVWMEFLSICVWISHIYDILHLNNHDPGDRESKDLAEDISSQECDLRRSSCVLYRHFVVSRKVISRPCSYNNVPN